MMPPVPACFVALMCAGAIAMAAGAEAAPAPASPTAEAGGTASGGATAGGDAAQSHNAARSRMRECQHQFSTMKKNGSAAGVTWKDFSQGCFAKQ